MAYREAEAGPSRLPNPGTPRSSRSTRYRPTLSSPHTIIDNERASSTPRSRGRTSIHQSMHVSTLGSSKTSRMGQSSLTGTPASRSERAVRGQSVLSTSSAVRASRRLKIRPSLMSSQVTETTLDQRTAMLSNLAGDCLLKMIRWAQTGDPIVDGEWSAAWTSLQSLRQTYLIPDPAPPFLLLDDVVNKLNPDVLARSDAGSLRRCIHLLNLATFCYTNFCPEEAATLLYDLRDEDVDTVYFDPPLADKDAVALQTLQRRNAMLLKGWKHFWQVLIPREKRSNDDALRLWLDFATQIVLYYQCLIIDPKVDPNHQLPALPMNRLEELFSPQAIGMSGQWDAEEIEAESDSDSVTGLEIQVVEAKWRKVSEKRLNEIETTDWETLALAYPYEDFAQNVAAWAQAELSGLNVQREDDLASPVVAPRHLPPAIAKSSPHRHSQSMSAPTGRATPRPQTVLHSHRSSPDVFNGPTEVDVEHGVDMDIFAAAAAEAEAELEATQTSATPTQHRPTPQTISKTHRRTQNSSSPESVWDIQDASASKEHAALIPSSSKSSRFQFVSRQPDADQVDWETQSPPPAPGTPSRLRSSPPPIRAARASQAPRTPQQQQQSDHSQQSGDVPNSQAGVMTPESLKSTSRAETSLPRSPSITLPSNISRPARALFKNKVTVVDEPHVQTSQGEFDHNIAAAILPDTQLLEGGGAEDLDDLDDLDQESKTVDAALLSALLPDESQLAQLEDVADANGRADALGHVEAVHGLANDVIADGDMLGVISEGILLSDDGEPTTGDGSQEQPIVIDEALPTEAELLAEEVEPRAPPTSQRLLSSGRAKRSSDALEFASLDQEEDDEDRLDLAGEIQNIIEEDIAHVNVDSVADVVLTANDPDDAPALDEDDPTADLGDGEATSGPAEHIRDGLRGEVSQEATPRVIIDPAPGAQLETDADKPQREEGNVNLVARDHTSRQNDAWPDPYMIDADGSPLQEDDTYVVPRDHDPQRSRIHGQIAGQSSAYSRLTGRLRWSKPQELLLYRTLQKIPVTEIYPLRVVWHLHGEYGSLSHDLEQFNPQHMKDKMRTIIDVRVHNGRPVVGRARYFLPKAHPDKAQCEQEEKEGREEFQARAREEAEKREAEEKARKEAKKREAKEKREKARKQAEEEDAEGETDEDAEGETDDQNDDDDGHDDGEYYAPASTSKKGKGSTSKSSPKKRRKSTRLENRAETVDVSAPASTQEPARSTRSRTRQSQARQSEAPPVLPSRQSKRLKAKSAKTDDQPTQKRKRGRPRRSTQPEQVASTSGQAKANDENQVPAETEDSPTEEAARDEQVRQEVMRRKVVAEGAEETIRRR